MKPFFRQLTRDISTQGEPPEADQFFLKNVEVLHVNFKVAPTEPLDHFLCSKCIIIDF